MASTTYAYIKDIVSVVIGADTYVGIESIAYRIQTGAIVPNVEDGTQYPTGAERMIQRGFPIEVVVNYRQDAANTLQLATLTTAADMVVTCNRAHGAADQVITFENFAVDGNASRGGMGQGTPSNASHRGFCYSDDGTALPMSVA